jgi:hypothetical protein
MTDTPKLTSQGGPTDVTEVSEEALKKAEAFIEEEEGAANRLSGWAGTIVTTIAVVCSIFHLYAAYDVVPTQELRYIHVGFVMMLCFLLFPMAKRFRNKIRWWDVLIGLTAVGVLVYALQGGDDFLDRAAVPNQTDTILGVIFIIILLEATRRTTGIIVPIICVLFILYALYGPYLPAPWTHRAYDFPRIVGHLFITLEGIFGRCLGDTHHPVHDLRRVSLELGRRQVLHRLLARRARQQAEQRRPHGRDVVVPARRPVGFGRRDNGDDRRRRLSDDGARGLREERRGRPPGRGRPRRDPVAAGAGRRGLHHRRVPEDQLSRRHLDGDHPDLSLLLLAAHYG